MQCIGDECSTPRERVARHGMRAGPAGMVVLVCFSLAMGYALAPKPVDEARMHLTAIAPPFVVVSELQHP